MLKATERSLFGNAGFGDLIAMLVEERLPLLRGEVAPVRDAAVTIAGDEVVEVFLEVRPGAAIAVNLSGANHLGERKSRFDRAHRPRHREEHAAARIERLLPDARGRNDGGGGAEMAVMPLDEPGHASGHGLSSRNKCSPPCRCGRPRELCVVARR